MRKRQPCGADLRPAWRARIDDAARDIEMRFGIAGVERGAGLVEISGAAAITAALQTRLNDSDTARFFADLTRTT